MRDGRGMNISVKVGFFNGALIVTDGLGCPHNGRIKRDKVDAAKPRITPRVQR